MWRVRKGRWLSLLQYMTMVISLIPIFTIYSAHVYSITVEGAWLKWKLAPLHHWSTLTEKFEKGERPGNKVIYLASSPRHMLALLAFFFSGSAMISLVRSCMEQACNSYIAHGIREELIMSGI